MNALDFPIQIHLTSRGHGIDIYALGAKETLCIYPGERDVWHSIQSFLNQHSSEHIFFVLSYELKNHVEDLRSNNPTFIPCPLALLFTAESLISRTDENICICSNGSPFTNEELLEYINKTPSGFIPLAEPITFTALNAEDYVHQVKRVKAHIQQGDIYELNFCQEFKAEYVHLDPIPAYHALLEMTNAPYSAYVSFEGLHLLCASPESYLEKKGNLVFSRPIKGTRKRDKDALQDAFLKNELAQSPKERAENIMICDLVRNDLSRVAVKDSVDVDELCAIYSYDTVHQMISTIRCTVPEDLPLSTLFKATFPMGSMTGAPKIRAMELIDELEDFRRGWFSGTIGYISPDGDMMSNVIIRSILYDAQRNRASIAAGGAITSLSDPMSEYEESLLKASALKEVLSRHAQVMPPLTEQEG